MRSRGLYEVRPEPGELPTMHGSSGSGRSDGFALHAKVFVFDRDRVFVGSMNFDQRSLRINTELGLIIDSPPIARVIAARFDSITQPANSYQVVLEPADAFGVHAVRWISIDGGRTTSLDTEPDVDAARRSLIEVLSLLRLDGLF